MSESNTNENPDTLTIELKECLKYIYASTRSVADLKAVEQKLGSLEGIRSTFNLDPQKSAAVDSLDSTISDLKEQVQQKKTELQSNEGEVQQRFRTMVKALTEACINKSSDSRDNSNQTLLKFSSDLKDSVSKEHSRLNNEIEKLKEQVEEAKQKEVTLKKELEDTKKALLEQQEVRFNKVKDLQTAQFKKLNDKVDNYVALVDKEKLATHVTDKVQTYVNKYRDEQRNQLQQQGSSSNNVISSNIKEYITREINANLEQLKPHANAISAREHLESLEKTTSDLTKLIETQRDKAEATQKQLASFKPTQGVDNTQNKTVTKHMEEVERHITVMYHNIKMVENFINFKVNNIAGGLGASEKSRKRARLENGEMEVDEDEDIVIRLSALEEKHQQMIDYVVQFRDNVLDPAFPTRIESALSKIEQVLLNHETFLSFLIDPFSTQQKLQRTLPSSSNNNNDTLHPSLIQAVTDLVRKTNDEVIYSLEEKIKELEQKLSARRSAT